MNEQIRISLKWFGEDFPRMAATAEKCLDELITERDRYRNALEFALIHSGEDRRQGAVAPHELKRINKYVSAALKALDNNE